MAVVGHVVLHPTVVAVYNVHLESRSDNVRRAQLAELLEDATRFAWETPIILAGDFNFDVTELSAATAIETARFQNPFQLQRASTARSRSLGHGISI
ncbi:MAG: hypothetical protein JOY79_03680, partial [Acidobacteriaceae bacterium]|nr:hypothetical protein [Acidobacteriaceae bacterium]